jgi:hypothetical protein
LLQKVNDAVTKGEIPTYWRDCKMAVLPKLKKDDTKLNGYWIITMTNVWITISEKVVAGRIVSDSEVHGYLDPGVGGTMPKRSTSSNLDAITQGPGLLT